MSLQFGKLQSGLLTALRHGIAGGSASQFLMASKIAS
jgi:hypothetical protein